ncbi:hypothetical protein VF21_09151 [Pseudogymnoascus sp. 05NY08]|nr:hypothetical protein VF21_09151 [Pseudogymnoascus sp. 05NY08]
MSSDRMLTTVLGAYQKLPDPALTSKILGSTTSLLTTLTNPLNISLLTSQLLAAPAIWATHALDLQTCLRIISIYNTAAITVLKQAQSNDSNLLGYPRRGGGLGPDEWATAVVKGADDKSPRWRHVLAIAGVLLGMGGQGRRGLSRGLRMSLEGALIMAANLAMEDPKEGFFVGGEATLLALNHTFDLLSEHAKREIRFDLLLPIAVGAMVGPSGYEMGQFVGAIDADVLVTPDKKLDWSPSSRGFLYLKDVSSRPLVSSMGPFSRLVAYTVEHLQAPKPNILQLVEQLQKFSQELLLQWRHNKLSTIDPSDLSTHLTPPTSQTTFPALFQLLKSAMFATVVILRSVLGRILIDPLLATDAHAASLSSSALHTLRSLYFISSRLGTASFTAYTFVSLTSIDILARYPRHATIFLESIRPSHPGTIPAHPLDRNLDLYYLNTAEHFPLILSPASNAALLQACTPYLASTPSPPLLPLFEAAHSLTLSVLTAPPNAALAASAIPPYATALLASFPSNLSARQFRLAFKSLLEVTTPPNPLAASHPDLPDTLLELLRFRAMNASTALLPQAPPAEAGPDGMAAPEVPLTEQAALTLALLDALSSLAPHALKEWLPLAAGAVRGVKEEGGMRRVCQERFWEALVGGEMDVERGGVCVEWWCTRGGREMVMGRGGGRREEVMMSGALQGREGRL